MSQQTKCHWGQPRLQTLERRIAPAGVNSLVSRIAPSAIADTGGGTSTLSDEFQDGITPKPRNISANGRYVAFSSDAANLVAGQHDTNGTSDVFLYDAVTNATVLVSRSAGSTVVAGNDVSSGPAISADGRYIAYISRASDLMAGLTIPSTAVSNIFLFDRETSSTTLVSHAVGLPLTAGSYDGQAPMLSEDGGVVVFASQSVNLVSNPGGVGAALFIHAYLFDRATGTVTLIDHDAADSTKLGNREAFPIDLSSDGHYVTFWSFSSNLIAGNTASNRDAYRFDRQTGENLLLSRSGNTAPFGGNNRSTPAGISADGRWIVFTTRATNLIPGAVMELGQTVVCDAENGVLSLVSHKVGDPLQGGGGESLTREISGDGQYVLYFSQAPDLVSGFSDGNGTAAFDLFLYDRVADESTLVSHQSGSATQSANAGIELTLLGLSDDGRFATFVSQSSDLVANFVDNNGSGENLGLNFGHDIYRFDRLTGANQLVNGSLGSASTTVNRGAYYFSLNADGNVLAYTTAASDVVANVQDHNGHDDVWVRDFASSTTLLASRRVAETQSPGGASEWSQTSADGRYVTFTSTAANLVTGQIDTDDTHDVFLTDRLSKTTWLVSRAAGTSVTAANEESGFPVISGDGRYVAYCSYATDLVNGFVDGNGPRVFQSYGGTDVYLFDRATGTNTLVSHVAGAANTGGNSTSASVTPFPYYLLTISDDGRFIGYMSLANDLVAGFIDNNGTTLTNNQGADVYVFDRVTGLNEVVSHAAGSPTIGGNGSSYEPSISGDGRYVAYSSSASNLVSGMTFSSGDVFVYDRQTGTTALVSHKASSATTPGNGSSDNPVLSKDGNYIIFNSAANNFIASSVDPNNLDDVFLYDRQTGVNTLVSHRYDSATTAGMMSSAISAEDYSMDNTAVSADGRFVVFTSQAGDLVSGFVDGNGQDTVSGYAAVSCDVFLFDRLTGANTLMSYTTASATAGGDRMSAYGAMSGDGRYISFVSRATNLGAAGTLASDIFNVFLYDRIAGKLSLVSASVTGVTLENAGHSGFPTISRDGSVVIYSSTADSLVAGDFNSFADIFAYSTAATVTAVQINGGAAQRSRVTTLTVTFDSPVTLPANAADAFQLKRQSDGAVVGLNASVNGNNVTLTFTNGPVEFGSLADGKYTLTALAALLGNFDGNGDGVAGDNYVLVGNTSNKLFRLYGDSDGDGDVEIADFSAFRLAFGNSSNLAFDSDGDGDVDLGDFAAFRGRFGTTNP